MLNELGIYIHIPFCTSKCFYCDFNSYSGKEDCFDRYFESVISELKGKKECFVDRTVTTIFIGGGTPSCVSPYFIEKILNYISDNYSVGNSCETTIEVNPGTISKEKLEIYRKCGINRISMGVQSMDDDILMAIGRRHTSSDVYSSYDEIFKVGFTNVSADLIFGLPDQTMEIWKDTIDEVLQIGVNHISCYSLKIEEGTLFYDMELSLPSDEVEREMYYYAREQLRENEIIQYEISNFAKKGFASKHNINCWKGREYIGIGAGAFSFYNRERFHNAFSIEEYINNPVETYIDEKLTNDEVLKERVILGLRLIEGVDVLELEKTFKVDVINCFKDILNKLEEKDLISYNSEYIKLTEKGMDFANLVMSEFI